MAKAIFSLVKVLLLLSLWAQAAIAKMPVAEMPVVSFEENLRSWVGDSDVIVYGECVEVKSFRPGDPAAPYGENEVTTHTRIKVARYIKGAGRDELTILTQGGIADGKEYWVEDEPRFTSGEKGYFFLTQHLKNIYTSLAAGTVEGDSSTEKKIKEILEANADKMKNANLTEAKVISIAKEYATGKSKDLARYPEVSSSFDAQAKMWAVDFRSTPLRGGSWISVNVDDNTAEVVNFCSN